MPRIRTIKPEFPQSESMGNISRDARLLFIQLWTLCDDEGRARASSRMLASLLYPYDSDAAKLIPRWIEELVKERCIILFEYEGAHYLQVCNWLKHQKIDRASRSKIPPPSNAREDSTNAREDSCLDQGSRIKDQGRDQGSRKVGAARKTALPPDFTITDRIRSWAVEKGHSRLEERLEHFVGYVRRSGKTYVDWEEALMGAIREDWAHLNSGAKTNGSGGKHVPTTAELVAAIRESEGYADEGHT